MNASIEAATLMLSLRDELELNYTPHHLGGVEPTLNVGVMISGGTYFGVVPGKAEFACDLRTLPGMTKDGVRESLESWADRHRQRNPGLGIEVEFEDGMDWVPPNEIDEGHDLVSAVQRASAAVLGEAPPLSVFPGGTDAPWFAAEGIPTIASFGPGILTSAHGPNEFVSVSSIFQAARIYARLIANYCGVGEQGLQD